MIFAGILLIVIAIGALLAWRMIFGRSNPPLASSTVLIGDHAFTVELARTSVEQARGLSGRAGLGVDEGMLFLFGKSGVQNFWMKDMNFPIDIIWIGPASPLGSRGASSTVNVVLGFVQNAPMPAPGAQLWQLPIYTSPDGVDTVLEVNAGTVARDGIKVGDTVSENGI